jgi:hypothetical protein
MDDSLFHTRTQKPYADLLQRDEWKIRKAQIIARDQDKCCNCGKTGNDVPLVVHHKCYVQGLDPWEYPDEALITLCMDCHHDWHQNNEIRCAEKREDGWYWVKRIPCKRCKGEGYLYQYYYHYDGICFRCWGERFEEGERRIRLFTEKQGKTPQEYFDVFAPLTDEVVKRIYEERKIGVSFTDVSYLVQAHIWEENGFKKVALVGNTGEIYYAFLDSSMLPAIDLSSGISYLNVKTLLFKECMNRNRQKYIIVKGELISYNEAKVMAEEIMNSHQH